MVRSQPFKLQTKSGREIHGVVDSPNSAGRQPVVVICHGFKGFMEWGFFPYLAELLAERGYVAVRFNFSGSGMKPGDQLVTDTESFRYAAFSLDLEDLQAVLAAVGTELAPEQADARRLGLIGHSRGGGTAILAAALESRQDRLKALVTWAAVSTFARMNEADMEQWRRDEVVTVVNARTGQELPVSVAVLDDLEKHGDALKPLAVAHQIKAPWLVLHGDQDETVDPREANALSEVANPGSALRILEGGDHTFGAKHPFSGPTPQLVTAMNATQAWFRRHLKPVLGES